MGKRARKHSDDPPAKRQAGLPPSCRSLQLLCSDGHLEASAEVLCMASPNVLNDMIQEVEKAGNTRSLKVAESVGEWEAVLEFLYPVFTAEFSLPVVAKILPLAHKYDITHLLASALKWLKRHLPREITIHRGSPGYVFKWLQLAEQLQLDELQGLCLEKLPQLECKLAKKLRMVDEQVSADLMQLSQRLMLDVFRKATARWGREVCNECRGVISNEFCGYCRRYNVYDEDDLLEDMDDDDMLGDLDGEAGYADDDLIPESDDHDDSDEEEHDDTDEDDDDGYGDDDDDHNHDDDETDNDSGSD